MALTVRADLANLPDYVPGRKIPGAVILSSNEVSTPAPPSVLAAIADAATEVNRYPQMANDDLMARTSAYLGVPEERIAIGCGSVSLCQQLIQAMCTEGQEVVFAWRSFEAYPIVTHIAGARGVRVPLTSDYRHDLDAMLAAVNDNTRVMFVANPNNPTGSALHTEELTRFLDAVPDHVLVVLDEAYREFVTDPDLPDGLTLTANRDNLAVVRTLSKAYGLAGLRVGYAVASPEVAGAVRKVGIPFSVSRVAQAAAIAAMDAADELLARCELIAVERQRVRAELLAMGYEVPETQANFVWLPLGERTAAFNEHLLGQKIVVRAFVGEGARVTVAQPEENDAFLAAARTFER
ncbi:histidinol-phosphate transaminase [Actinophytocola xinjiangensis]|uniref:Aromatic amino acid aminotransferase n=1 Tax=Actinophytocola xinjiangensis TaxID=485602 RepID=A0A7Z1AXC8_9PSEU|nr:histidinol-phosphate transaminase [Actinophytocola xinjiangensis]OLF08118.1 histidinol-phosphate transaminase [Actinophytocola xinjiangensis]